MVATPDLVRSRDTLFARKAETRNEITHWFCTSFVFLQRSNHASKSKRKDWLAALVHASSTRLTGKQPKATIRALSGGELAQLVRAAES
jgi:hypothetical protein